MEKILEGKLMIIFVVLVLGVVYIDTLRTSQLDTGGEYNNNIVMMNKN